MNNIPVVKLGLIAVSRDCFPIQLSEKRRAAIKETYKGELYECPVTVENEKDMEKALEDVNKAECNALVVFLGNFGPEISETLLAKHFDGPKMFVVAGGKTDHRMGIIIFLPETKFNLFFQTGHKSVIYNTEYLVGR